MYMKLYFGTQHLVYVLKQAGADNLCSRNDVSREDLENVLYQRVDAPIISWLRVANAMCVQLNQLVTCARDDWDPMK